MISQGNANPVPVPARLGRAGARADGSTFHLSRTQSDLAHELATSRESVARALGSLRLKGIISTEGRQVTLLSLKALADLAQGEDS